MIKFALGEGEGLTDISYDLLEIQDRLLCSFVVIRLCFRIIDSNVIQQVPNEMKLFLPSLYNYQER